MSKTKNLNGIPGNLALSFLSTLGYYNGGYMADWVNFIARDKKLSEIQIDILNSKIKPIEADIKPLKSGLDKLRSILEKELLNNGFEPNFITKAQLIYEIPIDDPKAKNEVHCFPFIEDELGQLYKPSKRIVEYAYETEFKPLKKLIRKQSNSWLKKLRESLR